jgi:hypothetical protein
MVRRIYGSGGVQHLTGEVVLLVLAWRFSRFMDNSVAVKQDDRSASHYYGKSLLLND